MTIEKRGDKFVFCGRFVKFKITDELLRDVVIDHNWIDGELKKTMTPDGYRMITEIHDGTQSTNIDGH